MKRLLKYARPYFLHIFISALASIGCSLASVWVIDVLKRIIDVAINGDLMAEIPELMTGIIAAIVVGLLSNYLVVAMTGYFGAGILKDMRRDSLNHVMKIAPDFMEKNNFGDIMERLSSDIEGIAGYMQGYFKDCIYVPIIVIAFAIYMIWMNPLLAALCLIPLAILVPISIILLKPVKVDQFKYVKMLGMTNNNIQEAFDGVDVIKSYNLQGQIEDKYYNDLKKTLDISNRNDIRQYNIAPISELIREAPTAITLCVGGYLAFTGYMTVGMMVAFISAVQKINGPLVDAYQLVVRTQMALISVKRVFYVMEMPIEETENGILDVDKSGDEVFSFKNVTFTYKARETDSEIVQKKAIDNFNLTINKGKRVALVGKSGSGKSTIIKLICRQYEADSGRINYFGRDFNEVSPHCIRRDIALISQDTVIFPMTVADNIRIGRPEATREEIVKAAKLAKCDEFIQTMPGGYDYILDEKGNNLSGGQRQRISIARAILKDADILLLDEPTSALDKETERAISKTLVDVSAGKTVITVAHRLSTITDYDNIVVMQDGRIVEQGDGKALLSKKGDFYDMYNEYMMTGGEEQ